MFGKWHIEVFAGFIFFLFPFVSIQPCHFDFAVFCPNITEAITSCNAGKITGRLFDWRHTHTQQGRWIAENKMRSSEANIFAFFPFGFKNIIRDLLLSLFLKGNSKKMQTWATWIIPGIIFRCFWTYHSETIDKMWYLSELGAVAVWWEHILISIRPK